MEKERPLSVNEKITNKFDDIINDKDISVIVEVMGGEEPALTYIRKALQDGKHVVTANKKLFQNMEKSF